MLKYNYGRKQLEEVMNFKPFWVDVKYSNIDEEKIRTETRKEIEKWEGDIQRYLTGKFWKKK